MPMCRAVVAAGSGLALIAALFRMRRSTNTADQTTTDKHDCSDCCSAGAQPPPCTAAHSLTVQTIGPSCDRDATTKRENYLTWDTYFMALALLSAQRSKDPATQVGAAIVNEDRVIVGIGYNGFPIGCGDDDLPWSRTGETELDTKYPYVCHAEMNAIMNRNCQTLKGSTIYVTLFPCNECSKLIIQSGIKRVVYLNDKNKAKNSAIASRRLLNLAGVECCQFDSSTNTEVVLRFEPSAPMSPAKTR